MPQNSGHITQWGSQPPAPQMTKQRNKKCTMSSATGRVRKIICILIKGDGLHLESDYVNRRVRNHRYSSAHVLTKLQQILLNYFFHLLGREKTVKNNINPPLCSSASEWNVSSRYSPVTLMTMPLRWPQIIPNGLFFSFVMFKWSNLVKKNSTCRRGHFFHVTFSFTDKHFPSTLLYGHIFSV